MDIAGPVFRLTEQTNKQVGYCSGMMRREIDQQVRDQIWESVWSQICQLGDDVDLHIYMRMYTLLTQAMEHSLWVTK